MAVALLPTASWSPPERPATRRGITLFEVETGKQVKMVSQRARLGSGITRVAFSPDGSKLLSGELDGWVTLWDLTADRELFRERLHGGGGVVNNVVVDLAAFTGTVTDLAFSPDGSLFATSGSTASSLRRAKTRGRFARFQDPIRANRANPRGWPLAAPLSRPRARFRDGPGLAFTRDAAMLIVGSDTAISIFRIKDGQLLRRIDNAHGGRAGATESSMESLAVTPDGRRILSAGHSTVPVAMTRFKELPNVIALTLAELRLWDAATGEQVIDLEREEHQGLGYASLSPDGRRVAVAEVEGIRILETDTARQVLAIGSPGSGGVRPAFSVDGRILAAASGSTVGLFDAQTGRRLHHVESTPAAEARCAAWSPSGDRVVTGHGDGIIRVWEAGSGKRAWSKPLSTALTPMGRTLLPNFVSFSQDGRRIIAAGGRDMDTGLVAVYESSRGLQVRTVTLPEVTMAAIARTAKPWWLRRRTLKPARSMFHGFMRSTLTQGGRFGPTPLRVKKPAHSFRSVRFSFGLTHSRWTSPSAMGR